MLGNLSGLPIGWAYSPPTFHSDFSLLVYEPKLLQARVSSYAQKYRNSVRFLDLILHPPLRGYRWKTHCTFDSPNSQTQSVLGLTSRQLPCNYPGATRNLLQKGVRRVARPETNIVRSIGQILLPAIKNINGAALIPTHTLLRASSFVFGLQASSLGFKLLPTFDECLISIPWRLDLSVTDALIAMKSYASSMNWSPSFSSWMKKAQRRALRDLGPYPSARLSPSALAPRSLQSL